MADATETKTAPTTTYIALLNVEGSDGFIPAGEFTVPSGQSEKAKQLALAAHVEKNPDDEKKDLTVAVVPARSWEPETFEKAPPVQPRFARKAAA